MLLGTHEDGILVPSSTFWIRWSQSTENPLSVCRERKSWTSRHETEAWKSNKTQREFIFTNTITQGSACLSIMSLTVCLSLWVFLCFVHPSVLPAPGLRSHSGVLRCALSDFLSAVLAHGTWQVFFALLVLQNLSQVELSCLCSLD